jgi:hypothetical protein
VLALDDVYPPATTYEELQTRIFDAVEALGLEIKTLDIEGDEEHITGVSLYDPLQRCEVMRFDSFLFIAPHLFPKPDGMHWSTSEEKCSRLMQRESRYFAALRYRLDHRKL